MMSIRKQARALAKKTADAYSCPAYRSWQAVAAVLLRRGLTEKQAEAVMLSKWTRWAVDQSSHRYGHVPANAIDRFMDGVSPQELDEMVNWIFRSEHLKS